MHPRAVSVAAEPEAIHGIFRLSSSKKLNTNVKCKLPLVLVGAAAGNAMIRLPSGATSKAGGRESRIVESLQRRGIPGRNPAPLTA